jgi:hypothetical protein
MAKVRSEKSDYSPKAASGGRINGRAGGSRFYGRFSAQVRGYPPTWGGQIPPPGDLVIARVSRRNIKRKAVSSCFFRLTPENGAKSSIPARRKS